LKSHREAKVLFANYELHGETCLPYWYVEDKCIRGYRKVVGGRVFQVREVIKHTGACTLERTIGRKQVIEIIMNTHDKRRPLLLQVGTQREQYRLSGYPVDFPPSRIISLLRSTLSADVHPLPKCSLPCLWHGHNVNLPGNSHASYEPEPLLFAIGVGSCGDRIIPCLVRSDKEYSGLPYLFQDTNVMNGSFSCRDDAEYSTYSHKERCQVL